MIVFMLAVITGGMIRAKADPIALWIEIIHETKNGQFKANNWHKHIIGFSIVAVIAHLLPHYTLDVWDGIHWGWQLFIHLFGGYCAAWALEITQGLINKNDGIQTPQDSRNTAKDAMVSWAAYFVTACVVVGVMQLI